ncbi:MAG: short chain dehydrogenase [Myxococcaceae bacterium]|nr:short chain dehydrogenase [Myxococcaceae bacterium]
MSRPLDNQVVLITGAGSGIGRETAFAFAERGAVLELLDIDQEGLERTALLCEGLGARTHAQRVDVTSASAMADAAARVHERCEAVDVLINNAGVGLAGSFIGTDLSSWDWAIDINVKGVVHGCHFFVPNMIARKRGGHVLNVSSAAGYSAAKLMPVYSATKYAVLGMTDSLRSELREHRIRVTTVCPGIIDTPITRNMRTTGNLEGRADFKKQVQTMYRRRGYGPERVAAAMLKAVRKGHSGVLPVSPEAWLLYYASRLSPRIVEAALAVDIF